MVAVVVPAVAADLEVLEMRGQRERGRSAPVSAVGRSCWVRERERPEDVGEVQSACFSSCRGSAVDD